MEVTIQAAMVGAVVGASLTGWLSYYISRKAIETTHQNAIELLHRQEFIRAAINFRSAFFDLLIFCQQPPSGSGAEIHIADFIINAIAEQTKAALLFRAYLKNINRFSFDQAWKEYSGQENWNEFNSEFIKSEYSVVFYDTNAEKKMCHLITSRVDKLFQFAPLEIEKA